MVHKVQMSGALELVVNVQVDGRGSTFDAVCWVPEAHDAALLRRLKRPPLHPPQLAESRALHSRAAEAPHGRAVPAGVAQRRLRVRRGAEAPWVAHDRAAGVLGGVGQAEVSGEKAWVSDARGGGVSSTSKREGAEGRAWRRMVESFVALPMASAQSPHTRSSAFSTGCPEVMPECQ